MVKNFVNTEKKKLQQEEELNSAMERAHQQQRLSNSDNIVRVGL
jgi:hypothetical protein